MTRSHEKTFGVLKSSDAHGDRWFPVLDGRTVVSISYKRREHALKSAKRMIHSMHQPFVDFQGNSVVFIFTQSPDGLHGF